MRDPSAAGRTTRRNWLILSGSAAGLAGAAVAGLTLADRAARHAGGPAVPMRDHRVTLAAGVPRLVIARGDDPAANVRAALAKLGGMQTFVKRGEVVLVKPNIAWDRVPAQAANTEPRAVAAVVRACLDAGASEVMVLDCPVHEAARTFVKSGIERAAAEAGARVVRLGETRPVRVNASLGDWPVAEPFLRADRIINVPVAKHHGSSRVTAGMKNWIGITGYQRARFHTSLHQTIADLALLMRPTLTLVDATRVLLRNGPQGGNLADVREERAVAVSVDPVAIDAWATELLGAKVSEVPYLALAAKHGLGRVDYRALGPVELKV